MSVVVVLVPEEKRKESVETAVAKEMAWYTFSVLLFHSHDIVHVDKRNLDAFRCLTTSLDYVEDSVGIGILCPHSTVTAVYVLIITL